MHWFDEDTIEVVEALLREDTGRLLVVITGRQLPSLPDNTEVFDLKPLSDAEADDADPGPGSGMDRPRDGPVRERCDGIPLYIEEVVAKLKEQASDAAESARCPTPSTKRCSRGCVRARTRFSWSRRPPLIGSRFDRRLLSAVVELGNDQVDDVLQRARTRPGASAR